MYMLAHLKYKPLLLAIVKGAVGWFGRLQQHLEWLLEILQVDGKLANIHIIENLPQVHGNKSVSMVLLIEGFGKLGEVLMGKEKNSG